MSQSIETSRTPTFNHIAMSVPAELLGEQGRDDLLRFFGEVVSELRKVTWPSRQETTRLTMLVLVVSIIIGQTVCCDRCANGKANWGVSQAHSSRRHSLQRTLDRHGHYGQPAPQCQQEATLFKRQQPAIPGAGPLRKNEQRQTLGLKTPESPVHRLAGSGAVQAVDRYTAQCPHGPAEKDDAKQLLLGQEHHRPGKNGEGQGDVQGTGVIAHVNILLPGLQLFHAAVGDLQTRGPENPTGPQSRPPADKTLGPVQRGRQQNQNGKDQRGHDQMDQNPGGAQPLYHGANTSSP